MYTENVQLDQIQNGQIVTIIDNNICNVHGKRLTITVKQNVRIQGWMHLVKFLSRGQVYGYGGLWWPVIHVIKLL